MNFSGNYRNIFWKLTKRIYQLIVTILVGITIILLILSIGRIVFLIIDNYRASIFKTPYTAEGIIYVGFEIERPLTLTYLATKNRDYYLSDDTSKTSRKLNATKICPGGTIDCYTGRRVRINGFLTHHHKKIYLNQKDTQVQELIVSDFELLE